MAENPIVTIARAANTQWHPTSGTTVFQRCQRERPEIVDWASEAAIMLLTHGLEQAKATAEEHNEGVRKMYERERLEREAIERQDRGALAAMSRRQVRAVIAREMNASRPDRVLIDSALARLRQAPSRPWWKFWKRNNPSE